MNNTDRLQEIDIKIAIIEGYEYRINGYGIEVKSASGLGIPFSPTTNSQQAMELLKKYRVALEYCIHQPDCTCGGWIASAQDSENTVVIDSKTPEEAICQAVIALHDKE